MARTKQAFLNGDAVQPATQHNEHARVSDAADEATDIQRWRLLDEWGRQTWHYLESDQEVQRWPQTTADRYFLGLSLVSQHLAMILSVLCSC